MKKQLIILALIVLIASTAFAEDGNGPRTARYDKYLEEIGVNSILRRATSYRETLERYDLNLERLGVNSILHRAAAYRESLARYDQQKAKTAQEAL